MLTQTLATLPPVISDATLENFASRSNAYDRDNTFFSEDFAELR